MTTVEQLEARCRQLEAEKKHVEEAKEKAEQAAQSLREKLLEKELELQALLNRIFGRKSERFIEQKDQLLLNFGDPTQVADAMEGVHQAAMEQDVQVPEHRRRKRRPRCEKLPEHLPRTVVTADLGEEEKAGLKCIGEDVIETLVYTAPKLSIRETHYPKYVDPADEDRGVMQAAREPGLVEGNRYDPSVAAQVVTAKYGYHLPVYRQEDLFAGSGWNPSRSTLLNILSASATLIRPLVASFADWVRGDSCIGTDDTTVRLLLPKAIPKPDPSDPKSGRADEVLRAAKASDEVSINAKMWAYRGVNVPLNVFDFTVSRHRDGPDLFLVDTGYQGVLLGDCYGANTGIQVRSASRIVHAACVAHARRKVRDAMQNHSHHAKVLLGMFGELYAVEDQARSLSAESRLELRQMQAAPVWDRMKRYLDAAMHDVLPKDQMSGAMGYLRNQWEALTYYLGDPAVPIDNNETEQLMKQVALGRKNWMFIGSLAAGYRTADLMTLVSSAVRNDLDVWQYVKGVLEALLAGERNHTSLRPDVWAQAHPEHVRQYRVEERRDRNARRDQRRQQRRLRK